MRVTTMCRYILQILKTPKEGGARQWVDTGEGCDTLDEVKARASRNPEWVTQLYTFKPKDSKYTHRFIDRNTGVTIRE